MLGSFHLFVVCVSVCVTANQLDNQPSKVIKLTLGVSKSTYLPLDGTRFIKNGHIVENPSVSKVRMFLGFIPLPPKYNPTQDKFACTLGGWTAKSYENRETEVIMFKNEQQKLVVFGFRGTEPTNLQDWEKNFDLISAQSTIGKKTFTTHKGFKDRYGYVASWFETEYKAVPQDYTITLTGHSLGAAEATIAAVYAAGKLKRRPDAVVTYGSPKVGKSDFKTYYQEIVGCDRTLRIGAEGDLITVVPGGYIHVCDEMKLGKTGNFLAAHSLYTGYEKGLENKYHDKNKINLGCEQLLE